MSLEILGASTLSLAASPMEGLYRLGLLETVVPGLPEAHRLSEDLHTWADAVFVGPNTVLLDNPPLTGYADSARQPVRVTLDPSAKIPPSYRFLDGSVRTLIGVSEGTPRAYVELLTARGIEPIYCGTSRVELAAFLAELARHGISNVLVEGGGRLNRALIDQGLVDRIHLMLLPVLLADDDPVAWMDKLRESQVPMGRLELADCDCRDGFLILRYEPVQSCLDALGGARVAIPSRPR